MKGIIASPGIAMGKVLLFQKEEIVINTNCIDESNIDAQIDLYNNAVIKSREQLIELKQNTQAAMGEDKAAIFNAQLDVLDDPTLEESVLDKIKNQLITAEYSLDLTTNEICEMFENLDDQYLKERAADIRDIGTRLMYNLKGINIKSLSNIKEACIIVAKDLTPSDTAAMDLNKVLGFATDIGGSTSHTSIMAKALEIPAFVGLKTISESVKNGDYIILDALDCDIIINPSEDVIKNYTNKRNEYIEGRKKLAALKELPGITNDGRKVELVANIGSPEDLAGALRNGAEGIGLFRTEFLYMHNTHFPNEEEQFNAYVEVAKGMEGKPVIIRTLDIGGDKELPYFKFPKEQNPFLGWRAIRMCLDRVDLFKTQLRAVLRASAFGKILVMFPMVVSLEEFRRAKSILEECKSELKLEGISFDENIEVGIMVETPAVVALADKFAKEADFFSIGTNDLTQYTLAVDRGNEKISSMYNPFNPAVLNSIKRVIAASHKENKWTGMCGELAGNKKATLLLLGMGLDEFSMSAASIPDVKQLIRRVSYNDMHAVAHKALDLCTSSEVEAYLDEVTKKLNID